MFISQRVNSAQSINSHELGGCTRFAIFKKLYLNHEIEDVYASQKIENMYVSHKIFINTHILN